MVPEHVRALFWDTKADEFDPVAFPQYTIERVLEHGDEEDVGWLLRVFDRDQVRAVVRESRHLSPRSATFWRLVFEVPAGASSPDV